MKKFAPWVLIPLVFLLLQALYDATEAPPDFSEPKFFAPSDARIRFRNVRQLSYDMENRTDAGIRIYRRKKRPEPETTPDIQAALLISDPQDRAYIMVEIVGAEVAVGDTIQFNWQPANRDTLETLHFMQGSTLEHFHLATWIYTKIQDVGTLTFQLPQQPTQHSVLDDPRGRREFLATLEDFIDLVDL